MNLRLCALGLAVLAIFAIVGGVRAGAATGSAAASTSASADGGDTAVPVLGTSTASGTVWDVASADPTLTTFGTSELAAVADSLLLQSGNESTTAAALL